MFENQPKGLYALALANTGERFGYYTMLAIFALFMQAKFGWTESEAVQVYAIFLAVVYFAPLLGGISDWLSRQAPMKWAKLPCLQVSLACR